MECLEFNVEVFNSEKKVTTDVTEPVLSATLDLVMNRISF